MNLNGIKKNKEIYKCYKIKYVHLDRTDAALHTIKVVARNPTDALYEFTSKNSDKRWLSINSQL